MPQRVRSHVTSADIRALREHHALSQYLLADMLGITQAMVSHMESGRYPVSEAMAILLELAVCRELKCKRGCVDPTRGMG